MIPDPLAATLRQSDGEVRRAARRQAAAPAQPHTSSFRLATTGSQHTRPHATRTNRPEILAIPSQVTLPRAINHGLRTPLPLPQAAMAQQRQHAHSRRLPSRWSCMRHCPNSHYHLQSPLTRRTIVLRRPVHPHRCRQLLEIPPQRLHLPLHLRGLDSRNLFSPRHDRHQQHRQDSPLR